MAYSAPAYGWTDKLTLIYLGIGILLALLFLMIEKRESEPILELSLFKNHVFSVTSGIGFIIGAGMFGALVMLPLYNQVVQGDSATASGLKLLPFMLGILTMSIFSGKRISKTGHYKKFPIAGTFTITIGLILMLNLEIDTPYWEFAIFAMMIGMGLGLTMQVMVIAVQNAVDFKYMGVATSANTFFRSLGSVFGAALFGSILTNRLTHHMEENFTKLKQANPQIQIDMSKVQQVQNNTSVLSGMPRDVKHSILESFVLSFHDVFRAAAPVTAIGIILAFALREVKLRSNEDYAAARQEIDS
jgi:MFS family permease